MISKNMFSKYLLFHGGKLLYKGSSQKELEIAAARNGDGAYYFSGLIKKFGDNVTLLKDSFSITGGERRPHTDGRSLLEISLEDLKLLLED